MCPPGTEDDASPRVAISFARRRCEALSAAVVSRASGSSSGRSTGGGRGCPVARALWPPPPRWLSIGLGSRTVGVHPDDDMSASAVARRCLAWTARTLEALRLAASWLRRSLSRISHSSRGRLGFSLPRGPSRGPPPPPRAESPPPPPPCRVLGVLCRALPHATPPLEPPRAEPGASDRPGRLRELAGAVNCPSLTIVQRTTSKSSADCPAPSCLSPWPHSPSSSASPPPPRAPPPRAPPPPPRGGEREYSLEFSRRSPSWPPVYLSFRSSSLDGCPRAVRSPRLERAVSRDVMAPLGGFSGERCGRGASWPGQA